MSIWVIENLYHVTNKNVFKGKNKNTGLTDLAVPAVESMDREKEHFMGPFIDRFATLHVGNMIASSQAGNRITLS